MLELDPHTPSKGTYLIHSLYFDDYKDISVYQNDSGLSERYKWRIRYYDDDLNYIVLERKEKIEGRCHKSSCRLSLEEYEKIVSGNITDILYDTSKQLIKELGKDIMIYHYTPKVIIDYERTAYIEEITNVRVTFDTKISASYELEHFLDRNYTRYYIQNSGENLLEVKFDEILPSYIRNIVESYGYLQSSFSKYMYGRKLMNGVMV